MDAEVDSQDAETFRRQHTLTAQDRWKELSDLFAGIEQRWDAWGLDVITLADILAREKMHRLIPTPHPSPPLCDACGENPGAYACEPMPLKIECQKTHWACKKCYDEGYRTHLGWLGGDRKYYNLMILRQIFKDADKDGSGYLDFLEYLHLSLYMAKRLFGNVDEHRLPFLKLIQVCVLFLVRGTRWFC